MTSPSALVLPACCHSIAAFIFCASAVVEISCKSSFPGQEYSLIECFFIGPGWFAASWFAASSLASFPICPNWWHLLHWFCATSSPSSDPFPGLQQCSPISARQCKFKFSPAICCSAFKKSLLKEPWCELCDSWANSNWKILLKRTSSSSDYRKCYSSLSVLPNMGAILLLSSHPWLNFNKRMQI